MTTPGKLNSEGATAGDAPETPHKKILQWAFLIRVARAQEGDLHPRVRNVRSGELVMEENSLPKGESPNGIPMPDAALPRGRPAPPAPSSTSRFCPVPSGPAIRLGFVAGKEITIPSMDGPMAPITVWRALRGCRPRSPDIAVRNGTKPWLIGCGETALCF